MTPSTVRTKPTTERPLLVFGAHPDDIEFGCGGVVAGEARLGRPVTLVVCSRGEAGTNGTPAIRVREARNAARELGAEIEFIDLGGDARFVAAPAHAIKLAAIIRRVRPTMVLAPTLEENQHPDHAVLGRLVRDACRLARFGGLRELRSRPPHVIGQLFYYAVTAEAEPLGVGRLLVDVSDADVRAAWIAAMKAHASQLRTRDYVEFQLTRARLHGLSAGVEYAQPLFPASALLVDSLEPVEHSARRF